MGNRFSTLLSGEHDDVMAILSEDSLDESELRAALSNAFSRIHALESRVDSAHSERETTPDVGGQFERRRLDSDILVYAHPALSTEYHLFGAQTIRGVGDLAAQLRQAGWIVKVLVWDGRAYHEARI